MRLTCTNGPSLSGSRFDSRIVTLGRDTDA